MTHASFYKGSSRAHPIIFSSQLNWDILDLYEAASFSVKLSNLNPSETELRDGVPTHPDKPESQHWIRGQWNRRQNTFSGFVWWCLRYLFQVRLFCANQFGVSETTDAVRVKTKDIGRKFHTSRMLMPICLVIGCKFKWINKGVRGLNLTFSTFLYLCFFLADVDRFVYTNDDYYGTSLWDEIIRTRKNGSPSLKVSQLILLILILKFYTFPEMSNWFGSLLNRIKIVCCKFLLNIYIEIKFKLLYISPNTFYM